LHHLHGHSAVLWRSRSADGEGLYLSRCRRSSGMVNVVIAPQAYLRDRAALQGVFVLIEAVLQKIARRLMS